MGSIRIFFSVCNTPQYFYCIFKKSDVYYILDVWLTHDPGVAQLVGRLVWDQDAASSSLATRTIKKEEQKLLFFYAPHGQRNIGNESRHSDSPTKIFQIFQKSTLQIQIHLL